MSTAHSADSITTPRRDPDRTRIEMMICQLDGGGAERFAIALAAGLDPERFSVGMIVTRPGAWHRERRFLVDAGVDVLELRRRGKLHLSPWKPVLRRLARADVLHAHMHGSNVWASILGPLRRVPVVVATEHSWSFSGQPTRIATDRFVVGRGADVIVAVSEADRRKIIEVEGIRPDKVRVIETGLVPHLFDSAPWRSRSLREELAIPDAAPIVATLGYLRPEKDLPTLVEASASLMPHEPFHLVIVGDGPERVRIESIVSRLGVGGRVHLLGLRDDVPRILAETDVFAMSSLNEGSPLALLEAMSAGCPTVATEVGGIAQIAPDGVASVLVPPRRPDLLAGALGTLLRDDPLRERLGSQARTRVETYYSFPAILAKWERLYLEFLERNGRAPKARAL